MNFSNLSFSFQIFDVNAVLDLQYFPFFLIQILFPFFLLALLRIQSFSFHFIFYAVDDALPVLYLILKFKVRVEFIYCDVVR